MTEEVDSFAAMFALGSRRSREDRVKRERAAQRTDKQRERNAIRTAQLNYRCAPDHKALAHAVKAYLGEGWSIADVMEEALEDFAAKKGYRG
jgi:hypothetical protein